MVVNTIIKFINHGKKGQLTGWQIRWYWRWRLWWEHWVCRFHQ